VHQILCKSWEKCYRNPRNNSTRLRGPKLESYTGVSVACPVKAGRTSVDDEHTGRPTSCTTPETVARIQEIIRQDRRRTIRDIAEEVEVGYGTCQRVVTEELGMQRVAGKFVPRILTDDQKQQRVSVCTELRQLASDDETFLSRVITGDESWVYGYDPETKRQSSQWKSPTSPRPKKARRVKSNLKSMIITFFDIKGICIKNLSQEAKL